MKLFADGIAVPIYYPTGQATTLTLAGELAARLDELTLGAGTTFSAGVREGAPASGTAAVCIGLATHWAANLTPVPWWQDGHDFGIRVVRGADRLDRTGKHGELHIIARDEPLLLRAAWLLLQELGWRHCMPNGVAELKDLWIVKEPRATLRTRIDRIWSGAADHLIDTIAGGTTNLNWSDGTDHQTTANPAGLLEGDLKGALGARPLIVANAEPSWLRHMGWTTSTSLQVNEAWGAVATFSPTLQLWDAALETCHYTAKPRKLYTDSAAVQDTALAYANSKVAQADALDWVSLARSDGGGWETDFADSTFGAKPPVTRQIQLANHVARHAGYAGQGIVIQAYGECAETPEADSMPDATRVCTIVTEAYRPIGKTVEDIIADYVDPCTGAARCPLGLYQYLYSSAWGPGIITATAGSPEFVVAAVNRVRRLPAVSPKVVCGEAMTEFGLYGLGYYCYMKMVLDVGRVDVDFTIEDFDAHAAQFFNDLYPTPAVREGVRAWYDALIDVDHKPLLSSDLLHRLWSALNDAMAASAADGNEQKRVVELCKFTHYLDLRNALEAAQAIPALALDIEIAYDQPMEWLFRIRDSGLVDADALFDARLDVASHASLGLANVFGALNTPPGAGRGANSGTYVQGWNTSAPSVQEFADAVDPDNGLISLGLANNLPHGLTDIAYSSALVVGWNDTDGRARQQVGNLLKLQPYQAKGKMKLWLIPTTDSFVCNYILVRGSGGANVEFVNHATTEVEEQFLVERPSDGDLDVNYTTAPSAALTAGQLYEIRLTTFATSDQIALDWWSDTSQPLHHLSFDPGREGDPCGFSSPNTRSFYFLVPAGFTQIHYYAEYAAELALFTLGADGTEVQDMSFAPAPRAYQMHEVGGAEVDRVMRIAGVKLNQIGFWLLNCPNLFAQDPRELLRPVAADG